MYNILFNKEPHTKNSHFQPGRMAYLIDLDDENAEVDVRPRIQHSIAPLVFKIRCSSHNLDLRCVLLPALLVTVPTVPSVIGAPPRATVPMIPTRTHFKTKIKKFAPHSISDLGFRLSTHDVHPNVYPIPYTVDFSGTHDAYSKQSRLPRPAENKSAIHKRYCRQQAHADS